MLGILIGSKCCFVPVAIGRCNYLIIPSFGQPFENHSIFISLFNDHSWVKHEKLKRHQIDDKRSFQITETRSVTETIFKSACY